MLVETNVGFGSEPTTTWSAAWQEIDPMVWDSGPVTTPS